MSKYDEWTELNNNKGHPILSPYDEEFDMNDDEWTELNVDKVVAETALALLVRMDGKDIWLPKSQLDDWPDVGDEGILMIKTWLAEEKELI